MWRQPETNLIVTSRDLFPCAEARVDKLIKRTNVRGLDREPSDWPPVSSWIIRTESTKYHHFKQQHL